MGESNLVDTGKHSLQIEEPNRLPESLVRLFDSTKIFWSAIFEEKGLTYQYPSFVLYRDSSESICAITQPITGPFYCADKRIVYVDQSFIYELERTLGDRADLAQAYAISHVIGHHVQTLIGITTQIARQKRLNPSLAGLLSQQLELQADCFSGLWFAFVLSPEGDMHAKVEDVYQSLASMGAYMATHQQEQVTRPVKLAYSTATDRLAWFQRGINGKQLSDCHLAMPQ
ncbi:hypothetical protein GCM10007894_00070 [Paraferrimonas haliotis]|uniref:Metalloprotease n=2 Tax=Paraferrimonas haliotis TaxID=2013866 RepID=A0AA37TSG7_9GAMM|nr:hypothetical protein GCM10007894_00070 [Paraferrimonas haliotis]